MNPRSVRHTAVGIFLLFLIAVVSLSPSAAGTAPVDGADVFARRCSGCHSPDSNLEGPRLRGVVGRQAGAVAGYPYSNALRKSGITWTPALLSKWLENPEALVRGTDMEFRVSNADDRAALVVYLRNLKN